MLLSKVNNNTVSSINPKNNMITTKEIKIDIIFPLSKANDIL